MKNYQKKSVFLILFGVFLNIYTTHGQTSNDVNTYNWFDKSVGKNNLDINNGTPHINPYRTIDGSHSYLIDEYQLGTLIYENQYYYDVKLKYDLFKDALVLNPNGESDNIGINLISDKVQSFFIKDKKFIRIDKKDNNQTGFTSGYYEENKSGSDFTFYIKHHKTQQRKVSENGVYYTYKENNSFYIELKNTIYLISGKNDIIKLFPNEKEKINGFYLMNRDLRKSDLNQFMRNLMKYITNSLPQQVK